MPRRASNDHPRRSAPRSARTSTATTAHTKPIAAKSPSAEVASPCPPGSESWSATRAERAEAVAGHRAQQLDDSEGIRLGDAGRTVGHSEWVGGVLPAIEERREVGQQRRREPDRAEERGHHEAGSAGVERSALTTAQMTSSDSRKLR